MVAVIAVVLAQAAKSMPNSPTAECSSLVGLESNVWERAKAPVLREYCDLVASGSSKLLGSVSMANTALEVAHEAEALLPRLAAARALEGRALLELGRAPEAVVAFRNAEATDSRALDDPTTLVAFARALARSGHAEESWLAYRALLPRSSFLSSRERTAATTEAGLVAMSRGPSGLDEALSALRDAARRADDEIGYVAVLALALARDRGGAREEARSLAADRLHGDPKLWLSGTSSAQILSVAPQEKLALTAFALELQGRDGEGRAAWEQYLRSAPDSPWAAHARRCLQGLHGITRRTP